MKDSQGVNRRGFIAWIIAAAVLPVAVVVERDRPRPPRVGHMDADYWGAMDVDRITLDGKEVERVVELHDVEGWLRRYTDDPPIRPEYLTGEVDVYFKPRECP